MHKILFATSEVFPLIKTGGLGDIANSLPRALKGLKQDIRIIMPAYRDAVEQAGSLKPVCEVKTSQANATILQGTLPGSQVKIWLVDCPEYFDRPGNPYLAADKKPWEDNAARFACFARVIVKVAQGQTTLDWQADIVHCNDWQTGLVPALLSKQPKRPATIFTIHNLAYQGLFSRETFDALKLPIDLWHHDALEFHSKLSFIKGGLVYADYLNTVSPSYADEIQTKAFGLGLEGLLCHRSKVLSGILNGIDKKLWDPNHDEYLIQTFNSRKLADKQINKLALQKEYKLPQFADIPLIGLVGRLVDQKGLDLILEAMPKLSKKLIQIVFLGNGEERYEQALQEWAQQQPQHVAVHIGFDESLAHRIEAGADMFLMPSRFEPCGLNQLYSLRYGTLPIVHGVGGLADTVVDANEETIKTGEATGFIFNTPSSTAMVAAIERALVFYQDKKCWTQIQRTAMRQDFSWQKSAKQYLELYQQALQVIPNSELKSG